VPGDLGLETGPDGCDVQRSCTQGARERSTTFGKIETVQVGMQPRAPARQGRGPVDDGEVSLSACDQDHPHQVGPLAPFPAPHARSDRAGPHRDLRPGSITTVCTAFGEPDPWPSLTESSAPVHES